MTEDEMRQKEEEEFNTGPLSLLTQSVKHNTQVCHVVIVSIINTYMYCTFLVGFN